jgi:hypothetical protein
VGFAFSSSAMLCESPSLSFIISLTCLRPSGLLWSHVSVCSVSLKIFVRLVGNRESGLRFLSGAFEDHAS